MPKKVDANQGEIVQALREAGASVTDLHEVGKGCPDIVVGWIDRKSLIPHTVLMEIKTENGRMTPEEKDWWATWQGHALVIRSPREALIAIGCAVVEIGTHERNVAQTRR